MNTNLDVGQLVAMNNGEMPETVGKSDANVQPQLKLNQDDEEKLLAEINAKYTQWRQDRRPYEVQWFINAALVRGLHAAQYNPITSQLETPPIPTHRSSDALNLVLPFVKAKLSKFLKARAIPVVMPSSTDYDDILNAQGTTKALEYQWNRLCLEEKYEEVVLLSMIFGKAFWWIYWDQDAVGQIQEEQLIGKPTVHDIPLGDVGIESDDAFGLLVSDMHVMRLRNQPEIMRIKARPVSDVEKMYQQPQGSLTAEVKESELFQYQRQIASLGARASTGYGMRGGGFGDEKRTHTVVKELFTKPCAVYPQGRYVVVASGKILHKADFLPFGLASHYNPYPATEFCDMLSPGQFWPSTMVEQIAAPQKQYNRIRNQVDEEMKLHMHPWMFIPIQANVHEDAFSSEAGQKIPFNFQPGMPPPEQWVVRPGAINQDTWRVMDVIRNELNTITNLYPASIGASGATSGFDTNLLQEAADSVHSPDIRRNELSLKDAAFKIRRLMKWGWDVPRLISIVGKDKAPEVFEFYNEQIDEHANILIDSGSALPDLKSARLEQILKLDERQAFGPPGDPARNRKLLRMLDMGSMAEATDLIGNDEEHARLENLSITKGEQIEDPMPWENHDTEYEIHTDLLKSPQIKGWPPEQRSSLVRHVILHVKWKNPQNALQLATVFGMQDVVAEIQQTMALFASVAPQQPEQPQQQQQPQAPPQAQQAGQPE